MEDAVQRAKSTRAPLARPSILERKIELLRQEYSDVLEILNPRYDLSAVGGLEHAVTELREVADIMKRGLTSAAPMGMILMGPPGTGKSFLAECFAKECGCCASASGRCAACTSASPSATRRRRSAPSARWRPWS
jgi:SpoVK/Ycf46/Vps4 family AAA+-type ATPase